MACKTSCKLCEHLVVSTAVDFANNNLTITIPAGEYLYGEKYCIVIAQDIPAATTVTAEVQIQIGDDGNSYLLLRCDGAPASACNMRTRTRYSTRVHTSATDGLFRLLGPVCCSSDITLPALDGTQ